MWLALAIAGCGAEAPTEQAPPPTEARPEQAPPARQAPPAEPQVPTAVLEPTEPAPAPPPPPVDDVAPRAAPPPVVPAPAPAPTHTPPPAEAPAVADVDVEQPAAPKPAAEPSRRRTWTLDPDDSTLYVLVKYDRNTALSGLGHDHTLAATGWSGKVTWDLADLSACDIQIHVPVGGLVVDPPGYRAKAGLEGETSAEDKPKILENAWGKRQLEKDRFPEITFVSTACSGDPAHPKVDGRLTLHGVTRQVSLPMEISVDQERFAAKGALPIKGTSYGFEPYTAALGAVKNQDALRIVIDVVGR